MPRGNYYQAGDNYGRAGNYAYQAGGFLSGIGKALGGVLKIGGSLLPGPVGTIARIGGGILTGAAVGRGIQAAFPPALPGGLIPKPGPMGFVERALPGGATGYISGRRRRLNPMNVKALRRASRRIDSFTKTARKALKHTGYMIVSRSSRRGGSPGVITRREASRALKR